MPDLLQNSYSLLGIRHLHTNAAVISPGRRFYFGKEVRHKGGNGRRHLGITKPIGSMVHHPIQPVFIGVELIVAKFIAHKQKDEQAASHAHSQTHYVDKGKYPVLSQVAARNFQVISQHKQSAVSTEN